MQKIQDMVNTTMTINPTDVVAGMFLFIYGFVGIGLYFLIMLPMCRMSNEIVGFRFLISQAITDVLLMVQFGVWPGLVIMTQNEITPVWMRWYLHIYLDFTWWAMVYHYTIIAWSRLAAVQWPNWFRNLSYGSCVQICALPWFIGLIQSLVEHQFTWFEPLWYSAEQYGMTTNWVNYEKNGSHLYYFCFNVASMIIPFPFYGCALFSLFKRQRKRQLKLKSRFSGMPTSTSLQSLQRQFSIESRLLTPSIINSILFVVGQVFITQLAKQGRWWNWAVMIVFATNSFVNPLLYFSFRLKEVSHLTNKCFSSVLRKGVIADVRKKFSFSAVYDYEMRWPSEQRSSLIRLPREASSSLTNQNF